jgi:hypothetical protein
MYLMKASIMLFIARRLGYMVNCRSPGFLDSSSHAYVGVEFGALPLVSTFTQVKGCLFSNGLGKALERTV